MKIFCLLILVFVTYQLSAQLKPVKLIAIQIEEVNGDGLVTQQYKVIKTIESDGYPIADTINVAYIANKKYENAPVIAQLTINRYTECGNAQNYFTFPDYDQRKGIEPLKQEK